MRRLRAPEGGSSQVGRFYEGASTHDQMMSSLAKLEMKMAVERAKEKARDGQEDEDPEGKQRANEREQKKQAAYRSLVGEKRRGKLLNTTRQEALRSPRDALLVEHVEMSHGARRIKDAAQSARSTHKVTKTSEAARVRGDAKGKLGSPNRAWWTGQKSATKPSAEPRSNEGKGSEAQHAWFARR